MKVTKVNKVRLAVGSKAGSQGRGILYRNPSDADRIPPLEDQIRDRVNKANTLYSVFYKNKGYRAKDSACNSKDLEEAFNNLIIHMVSEESVRSAYSSKDKKKIDEIIEKQIVFLKNPPVLNNRRGEIIDLCTISYPCATEEWLRAIIVRMRKSLKRGTNVKVAIRLLQGLAQMDGMTLRSVVERMEAEDKTALKKFLDALNRDYYHTNVIKSIQKHDIKVQPKENILALSGIDSEKRAGLQKTLQEYAASPEQSDAVLLKMKGILFDYFLPDDEKGKSEFCQVAKLFNIPKREEIFFDFGFETRTEDVEKGKKGTESDLEKIWNAGDIGSTDREIRVLQSKVKNRINYVNCGKYQQLFQKDANAIDQYWLGYIKEYIEKNYISTDKKLTRRSCYATEIMSHCYKDMVRFLCGKYIDIGKAVYHFAMPLDRSPENPISYGQIRSEYEEGISSFAYERIKAEETLQRDIAVTSVAAVSAFSRSVADWSGLEPEEMKNKEDILFVEKSFLRKIQKKNAKNQLLRFYGGASSLKQADDMDENELVDEILSHLKAIRNKNYHYTEGKDQELSFVYAAKLWEADEQAYADIVRQNYYNNKVILFYDEKRIIDLVERFYQNPRTAEAHIPAFRTIWKRKDLPLDIINENFTLSWQMEDRCQVLYEDALYYLLKEIYYKDFIVNEMAADYFFQAVEDYKERNNKVRGIREATQDFAEYISGLQKKYEQKEISFGAVCQFIIQEYNQQNSGKQEDEIYKHFKILLPICMKKAFLIFVKKDYAWLLTPCYREVLLGQQRYLDSVRITSYPSSDQNENSEEKRSRYIWHTFAHFLHPRQLNLLMGDLKSYIQYRQDIFRRAGYAGQLTDPKERNAQEEDMKASVRQAEMILRVLDFVRGVSGRISNDFSDYYKDEEEYAKYLAQYIDFGKREGTSDFEKLKNFCLKKDNNTKRDKPFDLFADEKNPIIFRNIEWARMYAGGDVYLPGYMVIEEAEFEKYYRNQEAAARLQAMGPCKNEKGQKKVISSQRLKNRLMLNEVTDIFGLLNDLLGKLVSLSYLRERDQMYLMLGFYYMAMKKEEAWKESFGSMESDRCHIQDGAILYQVCSVFDYGLKLLGEKNGQWEYLKDKTTTAAKIGAFYGMYRTSFDAVIRLFMNDRRDDRITTELRDYVDHSKYYINQEKSILDLYRDYGRYCMCYNNKLRNSVWYNFKNILEKYFIDCDLEFASDGMVTPHLTSQKFTYKLAPGNKRKAASEIQLYARKETFLSGVENMLKFSGKK